jgi:prepilin-type N-terminal cleavage/methylation domain-containing protein
MRRNIAIRTIEMIGSRTSYMMRHALYLIRRIQCGIGCTEYIPSCGEGKDSGFHLRAAKSGFTLIEIVIVVVIIAIAAMMAIPLITSADSFQIRSAANMIAADLEYAKTLSISRGESFSVVFDKTTESYRIEDQSHVVIAHPVKKGFYYIVDFRNDGRLSKVDIYDVDFDATSEIKFNYLGSPEKADGSPLNNGVISLRAGQMTATINIEPVTGFISIGD